jgi:hypothetical protein
VFIQTRLLGLVNIKLTSGANSVYIGNMSAHDGLVKAIKAVGGEAALARQLGLTRQAIHNWCRERRVPLARVAEVEQVSGVPREVLRPDMFARKRVSRAA